MIVAASAGDSHRQEGFGKHIDLVIEPVGLVAANVHRRMLGFAEEPKTGAEDRLVEFLLGMQARCGQQVAGDVLHRELIERHIGIECPYDVVPVAIRLGKLEIVFVPQGLGVADEIEPMPAPALAVMGRIEQPIHQLGESVGGIVLQEGVDLLGRRRQPRQIESNAANQSPPIGRFGRF